MKALLSLLFIFLLVPLLAYDVTLAWDPSPDEEVGSYHIYWGDKSGYYTNKVQSLGKNNTSITITNLTSGATYFFAATAVATNGLESDFSNEVSVHLVPKPNAPTGIRITVSGVP